VLSSLREPAAGPDSERQRAENVGYRAVLRSRNFVALLGLNVLFVSVGYEVFARSRPSPRTTPT
jgi:hypothetical protein